MQGPWGPTAFVRRRVVAARLSLALGAVLFWSTNAVVGGASLRTLSVPQLLLVQFASAAALLGGHRSLASRPAAGRFEGDQGGALLLATCVGAAGALAIAIADGTPWPGGTGWLAAAYLGVGPMALGYLLWSRAMAAPRGRRLAPLGYATPVLSTALLLATGHPIAGTGLLGAALALGSIAGVLLLGRHAEGPADRSGAA